jgi:hypothetical protein
MSSISILFVQKGQNPSIYCSNIVPVNVLDLGYGQISS